VIQGTPSLYGDLPIGIVRGSGKLKSIKEEIFDKNGVEISRANKNLSAEPFGAECTVERVNGEVVTKTYTMDDAARAGLDKKPGPWQQHRKRMLQLRARAWALKDLFSDVLSGASLAEYDLDELPETGVISQPVADKAAQLKAALSERKEVGVTDEVIPAQQVIPPHDPNFDADAQVELDFEDAPAK
jgi:hypothetical protein